MEITINNGHEPSELLLEVKGERESRVVKGGIRLCQLATLDGTCYLEIIIPCTCTAQYTVRWGSRGPTLPQLGT